MVTKDSTWEFRSYGSIGYDNGNFRASVSSTIFRSGKTSQTVGGLMVGLSDWTLRYENDGTPFSNWAGDGLDSFRTAAAQLSYKDWSVGFRVFTGKRDPREEGYIIPERSGFFNRLFHEVPKGIDGGFGANLPYGAVKETGERYRMGAAYVGYKGYQVGIDSYRYVGHPIQNIGAHYYAKPQRGFLSLSNSIRGFYHYQSNNQFTLW
ncbi:MAG TPA: hypothetical protein EYG92_07870 [Lutibacter sp.]|nr:hypothetical protein [Lutibacter sp.]